MVKFVLSPRVARTNLFNRDHIHLGRSEQTIRFHVSGILGTRRLSRTLAIPCHKPISHGTWAPLDSARSRYKKPAPNTIKKSSCGFGRSSQTDCHRKKPPVHAACQQCCQTGSQQRLTAAPLRLREPPDRYRQATTKKITITGTCRQCLETFRHWAPQGATPPTWCRTTCRSEDQVMDHSRLGGQKNTGARNAAK